MTTKRDVLNIIGTSLFGLGVFTANQAVAGMIPMIVVPDKPDKIESDDGWEWEIVPDKED